MFLADLAASAETMTLANMKSSTALVGCVQAALKPGQQGADECWSTVDVAAGAYPADTAALSTLVTGCIIGTTDTDSPADSKIDVFAKCDESTGWYMPVLADGVTIDTSFGGLCLNFECSTDPECTDGNQEDGDGCSSKCKIE